MASTIARLGHCVDDIGHWMAANRLQMNECMLNAVARVVGDTRKFDRGLTSLLHDKLHWLDVLERVTYSDGCHGVPLSSWSGTSVPRRPSHHILQRRFSASSAFRKPTPAHRTSLSTQHLRLSGVFDRWSDDMELAA